MLLPAFSLMNGKIRGYLFAKLFFIINFAN